MGFLVGGIKQTEGGGPGDIGNLRPGLSNFLQGSGLDNLFNFGQGQDIQPFLDLFAQQNERNFAQAKESAGNLTGTGFANILGNAQQKASTEQGAFLANLMEQRQKADQDRFANLLLGLGTTGVAGPQAFFQQGLISDVVQGGSQVAAAKFGAGG